MTVPATMMATVLVAPHRFELRERIGPTPGDEDVLVQVRACGICGTDLTTSTREADRRSGEGPHAMRDAGPAAPRPDARPPIHG
jgi:D-arabinose 1-dehydrogenase-like Zn-dependent alcohol dehydrogenase